MAGEDERQSSKDIYISTTTPYCAMMVILSIMHLSKSIEYKK
jgi:hypothetical protein